jgi:hypothetical protein
VAGVTPAGVQLRVFAGLPGTADDQAAAEVAIYFAARHAKPGTLTKSTLISWATCRVSSRSDCWYGGHSIRRMIKAKDAVQAAWDRLTAAGVIIYSPRQPLEFRL